MSFSSSRRKLFLGAFSFLPSLPLNHPAAGSGNVLKVQQLLHICSEHFDSKEKEEDKDKKEKKEKDKKEAPADMGAHQVPWAAGHSGLLRKDKHVGEQAVWVWVCFRASLCVAGY